MTERKNLMLAFILLFVLSVAMAGTAVASPAITLYVDPDLVTGVAPDDTFDVYVTVSGIEESPSSYNLFLAEFYMSFDPAVIEVVDDNGVAPIDGISPSDRANSLENILIEAIDNSTGWLHVTVGRPLGVTTGLWGTVDLAKITFQVEADGSSCLQLYDFELIDTAGRTIVVDILVDGFFASTDKNSHYCYACNSTGTQKNEFAQGETVYVVGGGYSTIRDVDIYVVDNATWTDGDPIGTPVIPKITVTLLRKVVAPHLQFYLPLTSLGTLPGGYYDIVVDHDQDGVYDAATDGIDHAKAKPGFKQLPIIIPEFPLGAAIEIALATIIVYVWWRSRRKTKVVRADGFSTT